MNVAAYIKRLGYSGSLIPSPETLRNLHRVHILTVPFENLGILHGPGVRKLPVRANNFQNFTFGHFRKYLY